MHLLGVIMKEKIIAMMLIISTLMTLGSCKKNDKKEPSNNGGFSMYFIKSS